MIDCDKKYKLPAKQSISSFKQLTPKSHCYQITNNPEIIAHHFIRRIMVQTTQSIQKLQIGLTMLKKTVILSIILFLNCHHVLSWPIPDTGQTKCYDNEKEIPCPQPGEDFYGQDGNYIINPPSYTKLDENGNSLPDDAASWLMVKDNVTGLVWEKKLTMSQFMI
jgi:hypothetical protein